jgi:hypothetical protein
METCPKHGTRLLLRRNAATSEIALACPYCHLEDRGGGETERNAVSDVLNKKLPTRDPIG